MNINKNKGMYLETIINNSIEHYEKNKIALFRKLDIPIKIIEKNDNNIIGKIYKKSDVDYYGIYKGKFIVIEAKQTEQDCFYINKMQPHQIKYMNEIEEIYKGISLLIINFKNYDSYYCIPWSYLKDKTKISIYDSKLDNYKLNLFFPGRIDFLSILTKKMYH